MGGHRDGRQIESGAWMAGWKGRVWETEINDGCMMDI